MRFVSPFMRDFFSREFIPQNFAGVAIDAEDREFVEVRRRLSLGLKLWILFRQFRGCGDSICLLGGENEGSLTPNHGSGTAAARKVNLPFNICFRVPTRRRIGFWPRSISVRPTPM